MKRHVALLAMVLAACGDNAVPGAPDGGAPPDAGTGADAAPDAPPPDAGPDAGPDAAPIAPPVITAVTVDGAPDRQVRHGGVAELTATGADLDTVRFAWLGDAEADLVERSPTTLRLRVRVPHGHAAGDLPLIVDGRGGTARFDGAVQVTPVVITPGGRIDGRGTYSSPMSLCYDRYYLILERTDVMELAAGTYQCSDRVTIPRGVTVRGAGRDRTIIRGTGRGFPGFSVHIGFLGTTVFRDLTIEDATYVVINLVEGDLDVIDVTMRRALGAGVYVESGGTARLTRFRYEDGWAAVIVGSGRAEVAEMYASGTPRSTRCADVRRGTLRVVDSVLERCGRTGVFAGDENDPRAEVRTLELTGTRISGAYRGIEAYGAEVRVVDTDIVGDDDAWIGVSIHGGSGELRNARIKDWDTAVDLEARLSDPWRRPQPLSVVLDTLEIEARHLAVGATSYTDGGRITMRRTRARGGLAAVGVWGSFDAIDLGTPGSPGANQLAATGDDGFALSDRRDAVGPPIDAHGTRLGGVEFDGSGA
jgi:hypothetical protein